MTAASGAITGGERAGGRSAGQAERPFAPQPPQGQPRQADDLKRRHGVQVFAEAGLAGLVAEQRAPGIGTRGAADQRPQQQGPLPHPPAPGLRLGLVDPEQRKGDEVHRDQRGDEVGESEQGHELGEDGEGGRFWSGMDAAKKQRLMACQLVTFRNYCMGECESPITSPCSSAFAS